jgi:hypothetical protein
MVGVWRASSVDMSICQSPARRSLIKPSHWILSPPFRSVRSFRFSLDEIFLSFFCKSLVPNLITMLALFSISIAILLANLVHGAPVAVSDKRCVGGADVCARSINCYSTGTWSHTQFPTVDVVLIPNVKDSVDLCLQRNQSWPMRSAV